MCYLLQREAKLPRKCQASGCLSASYQPLLIHDPCGRPFLHSSIAFTSDALCIAAPVYLFFTALTSAGSDLIIAFICCMQVPSSASV